MTWGLSRLAPRGRSFYFFGWRFSARLKSCPFAEVLPFDARASLVRMRGECPSGAEAQCFWGLSMYGLKPVPFKVKVVPFKAAKGKSRSFDSPPPN